MERERLAEITVEPADLVTHLIAKVKTVYFHISPPPAPRHPPPNISTRVVVACVDIRRWTNTTRGVCVQALNGTIAGRPFRLRRGEDGWKQKPFPIVKRQVCTTHHHYPPRRLGSCGDLTNPSLSSSLCPGHPGQFGLRVFEVFSEANDFVVVQFGVVPCPSPPATQALT
jgi:hypothetical protein